MRRGGRGAAAATHQLCSQLQEQQRSSFWTTLRLALDPTPRGYAKTAGMRVARQSSEGCPPVLESHTAPGSQAPLPRLYLSVTAPLTVFALLAALLLAVHQENYADLHTLLDTSDFLLSGMLALLFWTAAQRLQQSILRMLAVSFMAASVLELLHALAGIEWTGPLQPLTQARGILRPATWLPAAYVLPSGICALLWRANKHPRPKIFRLAITLLLAGASMIAVFYWLDLTRPALIPVPLLWSAIAAAFWRRRHEDRLYPMLSLTAAVLVLAHAMMLYSRAPHDTAAMVAHLGKAAAYVTALLSWVRMASEDMLERLRADQALAQLNADLEDRVRARTTELETANENYRQAQRKLAGQVERLNLLDQITRAIGERRHLGDIYGIVLRELEEHLPVDFGCVATYKSRQDTLSVMRVGERSQALAARLELTEGTPVRVDANGLLRCVRGHFVHEPDFSQMHFAFTQRLTEGGLRALVLAPLQGHSTVFGMLIVARRAASSFSSAECEFLRQLSEHIALAAGQAQTYTELQQAYEELGLTTRAVLQHERLRALGQMASGIAHDINNALSPVSLYTGFLLEHETGLSPRACEYLETIQRSIDDVGRTVARMREFYRPRESQLLLERVELNTLVTQVIGLTKARWSDLPQHRGVVIEVKTELCQELPYTQGAESEIRDALTNLVFNAVDALPDGGIITLRTSVVSRQTGNGGAAQPYACIEIQDTGIGMNEETRRRCVEPFFTTKGERGTGLGLASVYGMVERHNGTLEIDSELDRGTTVRLLFPAAEPGAAAAAEGTAPVPRQRSLRVLIVDDDPVIIESLRNTLQGDGHCVSAAEGGQVGIDTFVAAVARGQAFDVVITDLGMPYVDGRKVAAAIGATSPKTPIILLTGWGQRLIDEREVPPAVHLVLAKPPRLSDLRSALLALCSR